MKPTLHQAESRWPHRWATLLVCATFPLIWVGGLVTTYDAGMAVPDWPGTYGYNLFLYPWQTWIFGPWDLFIEHGHRLLGAAAGLLTIGLVISVFLCDRRPWLRWLSVAALVAVVGQGLLGGMRVLADERTLAMIHGCTGPAFFALCAAIWVMTSRSWNGASIESSEAGGSLHRLVITTCGLAYLQLIVGALLRHIPVHASPDTFRAYVMFHLVGAGLTVVHVLLLAAKIWRRFRQPSGLKAPALALVGLLGIQVGLGVATWVSKYGWPVQSDSLRWIAGHLIEARGFLPAVIITGHVAAGSLILATSTVIAVRALGTVRGVSPEKQLEASWRTAS